MSGVNCAGKKMRFSEMCWKLIERNEAWRDIVRSLEVKNTDGPGVVAYVRDRHKQSYPYLHLSNKW